MQKVTENKKESSFIGSYLRHRVQGHCSLLGPNILCVHASHKGHVLVVVKSKSETNQEARKEER